MLKIYRTIIITLLMLLITPDFTIAETDTISEGIAGEVDENVRVPVLLYHNLMDGYDPQDASVQISPAEFEEHMTALVSTGYSTITFEDYYNYVVYNQALPDKPIIITFDDGYSSNYEYAYPILKKLNMKATIFVITGRMGVSKDVIYPHFTWEQAREMEQSGVIDIESHSDLHPDMTKVDKGRAQLELRRSRYLIERELGKTCKVFAYPYGLYNADVQDLAEKAGYEIQVAVGDKGVNVKKNGLKQLKRLTAFGNTSGNELIKMIEDNMRDEQN